MKHMFLYFSKNIKFTYILNSNEKSDVVFVCVCVLGVWLAGVSVLCFMWCVHHHVGMVEELAIPTVQRMKRTRWSLIWATALRVS